MLLASEQNEKKNRRQSFFSYRTQETEMEAGIGNEGGL